MCCQDRSRLLVMVDAIFESGSSTDPLTRNLSLYDISILYRPGLLNGNADVVSRIPCNRCDHCAKQESLDAERADKKGVTHTPCIKMTLRSDTHNFDNDSVEENPQSSSWIKSRTPQDLRNAQLNNPTLKLIIRSDQGASLHPSSFKNWASSWGSIKPELQLFIQQATV